MAVPELKEKPNSGNAFQVSQFLKSQWPNQVTWPSQESEWEDTSKFIAKDVDI